MSKAVESTLSLGHAGFITPGGSSLRRARRRTSLTHLPVAFWAVLDFVLCSLCTYFALKYNPFSFAKFGEIGAVKLAVLGGVANLLASIIFDFFAPQVLRAWPRFLRGVLGCAFITTIITIGCGYFFYYEVPGRKITLGVFLGVLIALSIPRLPFLLLRRYFRKRLLFLGDESASLRFREALAAAGPYGPEPVASFTDGSEFEGSHSADHKLEELCSTLHVDEVVIASPSDENLRWAFERAISTVRFGCRIRMLADLIEEELREVPLDLVTPAWLLTGGWDLRNHLNEILKRAMDITVALLGLVVGIPVYAVIALITKLSSPGPILYSQQRVGRFGVPFKIWKFRTMQVDAEKDGPQWAETQDPRVTWFGGILRKTRLDETPQFWNVFVGHMSLVGPRPERPEFVNKLGQEIPFYHCRHLLRPGITGWAQINFRYGASGDDSKRKLQFELYYMRRHSIILDAVILLRTAVALCRGSR